MIRLPLVVEQMCRELENAAAGTGASLSVDPNQLLDRSADMMLNPPSQTSPNGSCRLIEAQDGWIAVNLAREDDIATVPAWIGCALDAEPWEAIELAARERTKQALLDGAMLLNLPVSVEGETSADQPEVMLHDANTQALGPVIDLSALWAGPLCGGLLAEAGLEVTKLESPKRPDPTPQTLPTLDQRLNGKKRRLSLELNSEAFRSHLDTARVLITSARPIALERLGLTPSRLFERNPDLLWIAISAHGWTGPGAMRVGFGDDCAAAGGLVSWDGNRPMFMGDAPADPLTGIAAATLALQALAEGKAGLIDISLASTAARVREQA